jgi:predicted small integral membrane protein
MHRIYNYLIFTLIVILFILLIKELRSKKGLYSDILFNGAFVSSMSYILIVILRSILDSFIIMSNITLGVSPKDGAMIFFNNNSLFILITVSCLLIYNILMMIGEKEND